MAVLYNFPAEPYLYKIDGLTKIILKRHNLVSNKNSKLAANKIWKRPFFSLTRNTNEQPKSLLSHNGQSKSLVTGLLESRYCPLHSSYYMVHSYRSFISFYLVCFLRNQWQWRFRQLLFYDYRFLLPLLNSYIYFQINLNYEIIRYTWKFSNALKSTDVGIALLNLFIYVFTFRTWHLFWSVYNRIIHIVK